MVQQVLKHLREKGDIDLTICLAILTGILGLLGRVPPQALTASILTILALLAFNILKNRWTDEKLQETVRKLEEHLPLNDGIISSSQEEAENFLKRYIAEHSLQDKDAVVIQCSISVDLVKKLLESNARVTVFMQDEDTAKMLESRQQYEFIKNSYNFLAMGLSRPIEQYPIRVYKYHPVSAIYGIRIDEQVICLSWYTYEYPDDSNRHALGNQFQNDSVLVLGHSRAAVVVKKDQEGFDVFRKTFKILEENYRRNALCIFPTTASLQTAPLPQAVTTSSTVTSMTNGNPPGGGPVQ